MEIANGAITPEEALEYMKKEKDLFVIDASPDEMYQKRHFKGAVSMPLADMPQRYKEIPEEKPVLIHCRMGHIAPRAYKFLKKKRPDIKRLNYIDGIPLFDEYNGQKKSKSQIDFFKKKI